MLGSQQSCVKSALTCGQECGLLGLPWHHHLFQERKVGREGGRKGKGGGGGKRGRRGRYRTVASTLEVMSRAG